MTNTNDPGNRDVHGTSTVTPAPAPVAKSRPWWLWLLPLLLLLGLLFFALRSCEDDEVETERVNESTTMTTTAPGAAATPAVGVERVTLPGGQAVELEPNSLNYQLQQFLASPEPAPRRFTFDRLNFATNSADLPADAQSTVVALAQIMNAYPNAQARIEGYADARGSEPVNAQLGARRAEAVAQALIAQGVPAARVTAATGGESNPVDTNATAEGRAENRRTELVVTAK